MYKRSDPAKKTLLSELAQLTLYNLYDGDYGKGFEVMGGHGIQQSSMDGLLRDAGISYNTGSLACTVIEKRGMKCKRNEAAKHQDLKEAKKVVPDLILLNSFFKTKNEDHSQITECKSELDELKVILILTRTALWSKLLKDKILSGNKHVQATVSDQLQSNLLGRRTKVQSHILSSKVLTVEIASIIEPLRKMTKVEVEAGEDAHKKYSTVGFIKGNEDSDWSESDTKVGDIKQKKNRRDQWARQVILEKYEKNANHKKQEAATEAGRKR
ncbi:hypothetical protein ARMGADRAFT_1142783 [Armillaria gallica]|uniref:Bud22 domain-containing protein n=1 Tax=Armillaria gallica TaxID=47427 RepID=A0A2H3E681_ARMGA|nr:hypothetical protein ARMGADRAFT_1142783 [Armillaria gallica]